MITAEQLCEWQAVCDKATPGPWRTVDGYDIVGVAEYIIGATDVDFMIAARVAMPSLLDEVKRLRALLRDWDAACKGHCDTEAIAARVAEALR